MVKSDRICLVEIVGNLEVTWRASNVSSYTRIEVIESTGKVGAFEIVCLTVIRG